MTQSASPPKETIDLDELAQNVIIMTHENHWPLERALFFIKKTHSLDKKKVNELRDKVLNLRVELGLY